MFEHSHSIVVDHQLHEAVRRNCDISDARDHGIYSMCSMVLKLRNLYKWEHGIEPWQEPEASDLLEWIDRKEAYWQTIGTEAFQPLIIAGRVEPPFNVESINKGLSGTGLSYGAGYGRSMKSVFFLAEERNRLVVQGCPVVVLGTEYEREMAAPFAMSQNGLVIIRLEPLRFFLWDHIQELRSSCKSSYLFTLQRYRLLTDGALDQGKLRARLGDIVTRELDLFIYHEIGELLETTLDSLHVRTMIGRFPGSVIEFVCRAVKDVLADTHLYGALSYIFREQRSSSLGLYVSFLSGLRQELFPEMAEAWKQFLQDNNWQSIESARIRCRKRLQVIASSIAGIAESADHLSDKEIIERFNEGILEPLGMEMPPGANDYAGKI